jgi:hypothetical protein
MIMQNDVVVHAHMSNELTLLQQPEIEITPAVPMPLRGQKNVQHKIKIPMSEIKSIKVIQAVGVGQLV